MIKKGTVQGFADDRLANLPALLLIVLTWKCSTWARGQAWGIYAYANSTHLRLNLFLLLNVIKCFASLVTRDIWTPRAYLQHTFWITCPLMALYLGMSYSLLVSFAECRQQGFQCTSSTGTAPCGFFCRSHRSQWAITSSTSWALPQGSETLEWCSYPGWASIYLTVATRIRWNAYRYLTLSLPWRGDPPGKACCQMVLSINLPVISWLVLCMVWCPPGPDRTYWLTTID